MTADSRIRARIDDGSADISARGACEATGWDATRRALTVRARPEGDGHSGRVALVCLSESARSAGDDVWVLPPAPTFVVAVDGTVEAGDIVGPTDFDATDGTVFRPGLPGYEVLAEILAGRALVCPTPLLPVYELTADVSGGSADVEGVESDGTLDGHTLTMDVLPD